jgi:hypothetical protein
MTTMAKKPPPRIEGTTSLWEAGPIELKAYVDRRLAAQAAGVPAEPVWFEAAFDDSWPVVIDEADAG